MCPRRTPGNAGTTTTFQENTAGTARSQTTKQHLDIRMIVADYTTTFPANQPFFEVFINEAAKS
jgi:hypothetical protein